MYPSSYLDSFVSSLRQLIVVTLALTIVNLAALCFSEQADYLATGIFTRRPEKEATCRLGLELLIALSREGAPTMLVS